jgi:tryptophan halogenase
MTRPVESVAVLGAGSAGLLAALAFQRAFPTLRVQLVYSPDIPVIGVGESTTVLFPPFLHQSLAIDAREFFRQVRPSWKLGIRFLWGDPRDTHFNYPFDQCMGTKPASLVRMPGYYCLEDWTDASRCSALMDRGLSPCFRQSDGSIEVLDSFGYHIDNEALVAFLFAIARKRGIELIAQHVGHVVQHDNGDVASVTLASGRELNADLFVDCTGFQSRLLGKLLDVPFVSYADSLYCDTAVVGRWNREEPCLPYTTAETMNHGWCWQIEFPGHVTRGYVFCSAFCSRDEAVAEFRQCNPHLDDELRFVSFRSGRYHDFWRGNVVAVGNSSGFAEPLEATALHMIIEQIRLVCRILSEGNGAVLPALREVGNERFRQLWDEVRDFLAVHYRFNRRRNTPFWQHCRENVNLHGASQFVELYRHAGPSSLCATTLPVGQTFGYDGFMNLMIGQRVPTLFEPEISDEERRRWIAYRNAVRGQISTALCMTEAMRSVCA